jgi:hypothetical protein
MAQENIQLRWKLIAQGRWWLNSPTYTRPNVTGLGRANVTSPLPIKAKGRLGGGVCLCICLFVCPWLCARDLIGPLGGTWPRLPEKGRFASGYWTPREGGSAGWGKTKKGCTLPGGYLQKRGLRYRHWLLMDP